MFLDCFTNIGNNNATVANKAIDKNAPALFLLTKGPNEPKTFAPKKPLIYSPLGKEKPINNINAEDITIINNNFFIESEW